MSNKVCFNPHVIMQICKNISDMKRINSECRSSKCTVMLENIERLLEEKEII